MLNLAIVGVGLVGSELLKQLAALPAKHANRFKVILIASSKHALLNPQLKGLQWKAALARRPQIDVLSYLTDKKNEIGGPMVLVDNTSSDTIASTYPSYLK